MSRVLLLCGGNSAGKTTVLEQLRAESNGRTDTAWLHPDRDGGLLKGNTGEQYKELMRYWIDPGYAVVAIEGTRIYSAVFMAMRTSWVPRRLHLGILRQLPEVGLAHLKARCEKANKKFRDDYWTPTTLRGEMTQRHANAAAKFLREFPTQARDTEVKEFWIGLDYAELAHVRDWAATVLA